MSNETWLIGLGVDASKRVLVTTKNLVFGFELFIGVRSQKKGELTTVSSCKLFDDIGRYFLSGSWWAMG
jgi:hypothetical protein